VLADRGYNADPEAVTLLSGASDPGAALARALELVDDDAVKLTVAAVRRALGGRGDGRGDGDLQAGGSAVTDGPDDGPAANDTETRHGPPDEGGSTVETAAPGDRPGGSVDRNGAGSAVAAAPDPPVSTGTPGTESSDSGGSSPVETGGSEAGGRDPTPAAVDGDVTGRSTGTGTYGDFVATFRDRYERLSRELAGRVNHRPTDAVASMTGGSDAALIGMVNDIRSTASGHWLVELEDTSGTFPCLVMRDRPIADLVDELLTDEVIAVEGTLADDGGVLFVDAIQFPDVPRTNTPSTADRPVKAALVSDVHVGSQEFRADAWSAFADWLHTPDAADVEYLLIAGDMVEGVGVYRDQDEELDVLDVYEQYEAFSERLKEVPGDLEIVMIPGNHDAVRLAEPQPAFDEELRAAVTAHDARVVGNPSTVTIEGVSVLMYHGVSLDELIAELPEEKASYDAPHRAMFQLLKKRHVAPQYGGHTRIAPEERDYLVVEEVPDVFHTGHVHKLGYGTYHGVLAVNSGCWQEQTAFQRSVDIDPDWGYAPVLDLQSLDLTVRDFTGA